MGDELCETSTTEERRRKEEAEAAGAELKTKTPHNDVGKNPRLNEELQNLLNAAALDSQLDQGAERQSRSSLVQIENCDEVLNELPGILNSVFRMKVAKEREVNLRTAGKVPGDCQGSENCVTITLQSSTGTVATVRSSLEGNLGKKPRRKASEQLTTRSREFSYKTG